MIYREYWIMEIEEVVKWDTSLLIKVELIDTDSFLKIKETLSRIGISTKDNVLYQSCHIVHKRGVYFIVHFKEMFAMDGKHVNFTLEDMTRRNRITLLLEEWGLLEIVSDNFNEQPRSDYNNFKVIPYKDKHNWELIPKYSFGR